MDKVKITEPSVQLVLKDTNLHFEAGKLMSIPFQAECQGFEGFEHIECQWTLYKDGYEKNQKITSGDSMVIGIHSMYAGYEFCLKLELIADRTRFLPAGFVRCNPKTDWNTLVLTAEKKFTPTCDKKLLAIEWRNMSSNAFYRRRLNDGENSDLADKTFHLNGSDFAVVYACVELAGYNGSEARVYIDAYVGDDKTATLISETHVYTIENGNIGAGFSRNSLRMNMKPDDVREATLVLRIQEPAHSGGIIADFQCKVKVYGTDRVEELTSFPLQPVVVGSCDIVDNNFHPCKYMAIDAEYVIDPATQEKKTIRMYSEGSSTKPMPVYITGGKRKAVITLKEYTPEKCSLKTDSHKRKTTIFPPGLPIKDGKIELDLHYDYGFSIRDEMDFRKLFQYFCLPADKVRKHLVQVATCRCSHELHFNLLPDIKWKFYAGFGMSYPEYSRKPDYSQLRAAPYPRKKSIREQHKAAAEERDSKTKSAKYVLGMEVELNDGESIDVGGSIELKVKSAVETMQKIMEFLRLDSFFSFKDDAVQRDLKAKEEMDKQVIEYTGRPKNSSKHKPFKYPVPLFMDIGTPMLFVGGEWQYDDSYGHDLCRKGSVFVEAKPLIQVKAGIDLIALSMYIPVVGQIIGAIIKGEAALERVIKITSNGEVVPEMDLWFNVYLEGSIQFRGELNFSKESKSAVLEPEATIILGIELGLKCAISVKTVTFWNRDKNKSTISGELSAEANLYTGFAFTPSVVYDTEKGMFLDIAVEFKGVMIEYKGTAKIEKTENKGKEVPTRNGKHKEEVKQEGWSLDATLSGEHEFIDSLPPWKWHFEFPKEPSQSSNN